MNIYLEEKDGILILLYKSLVDLKSHWIRIHHYYEQSVLKGPLKGINLPFSTFNQFIHASELNEHELQLVNTLNSISFKQQPIYILASLFNDQSTLYHEWAHAQYYTSTKIQTYAREAYENLPKIIKKSIDLDLKMRGYAVENYIDEFQAYLVESSIDFGKKHEAYLMQHHLALRKLIPKPNLKNMIQCHPKQEQEQ
jgi:hypothetical protein